jgi:hypothetical protein
MMHLKTSVIILLFASMFPIVSAQNFDTLNKIELKEAADYQKNEPQALECANYLLSTPVDKNNSDLKHLKAIQFMIRWMDGTPDFSFGIDASIDKATESNPAVLSKFLASMVKYVLENKAEKDNTPGVKYNAFLTFLEYCENLEHKVNLNKELKKLIKAKNDGTLKASLDI